jgi:Rrf2 family protein
VRISAKVDYAVRALCEVAARSADAPVKAEEIARAQDIPLSFLENILVDLKRAGFVRSQRGQVGGYRMAAAPSSITIADVIRAVEGPLASVRGGPPEDAKYAGAASSLPSVWIAVRVNLRRVVEHVTIADVANSKLPRSIEKLTDDPGAWVTR